MDVEAGHFDLEVEAGCPTPDGENFLKAHEPYGKWGMILDRTTRRIRAGTPDHYMTPRWEHREGRVWRFFTAEEHYRRALAHMRVGDAYVHVARGFGNAVLAQGCDSIRLENVVVHAAPGLAVGLVGNRGEIIVRGLEVRFAPGTNRFLTTNADGVHCQQNRSGPVIEDCYFEGMATPERSATPNRPYCSTAARMRSDAEDRPIVPEETARERQIVGRRVLAVITFAVAMDVATGEDTSEIRQISGGNGRRCRGVPVPPGRDSLLNHLHPQSRGL
ncbi:MAG: hypothetical protein ACYC6Y_08460 [Thermoguttaceae bacterium]